MPSQDRRAAGRRRAWGRGPVLLRMEPLEPRALLSRGGSAPLPDLVNSGISVSSSVANWKDSIEVNGKITNQGNATTTAPVVVVLYASPVRGISKNSLPIGQVTIPAGVAPRQAVPYQTTVQLPATPIPSVKANGGTLSISASVNPGRTVPESNYHNDRNLGPPYDSALILMQTPSPASLVGTTLAVQSSSVNWGDTITVTAQITNNGSGSSPQTQALLSLTPQGLTYGGSTTIGVGTITVPPLAPYQTVNLVQQVTLPDVEPVSIANYTNFALTMTQDANYATNVLFPGQPDQGLGKDQTALTITTSSTSTATAGPLPDLAASSVIGPTKTVQWGQSVQVSTTVQNLGQGDAGPFKVFYVLTGQSGSTTDSIYLGQTEVSGLAAGADDPITQTLTLPTVLPSGVNLGSVGYARIAVVVDANNVVNESLKTNNVTTTAPFVVRLPGNATTVPTTQPAGKLPSVDQVALRAKNVARTRRAHRRAARFQARHPHLKQRKLHRHAPPDTTSLVSKGVNLASEVHKLPSQILSVLKKSL